GAHVTDHTAHGAYLADTISSLGVTPPVKKDTYTLPTAFATENDILTAVAGLEETATQALYVALPRVTRADLRQGLASVFGVEAQHVAVIRAAQALDPVPQAFIDLGLSTK